MKFIVTVLLLVGLAMTSLQVTCEDCSAVVTTLSDALMESMEQQVGILLSDICPQFENPEECQDNLPGFWSRVAGELWPGYFDPTADWMCGDSCLEQTER